MFVILVVFETFVVSLRFEVHVSWTKVKERNLWSVKPLKVVNICSLLRNVALDLLGWLWCQLNEIFRRHYERHVAIFSNRLIRVESAQLPIYNFRAREQLCDFFRSLSFVNDI